MEGKTPAIHERNTLKFQIVGTEDWPLRRTMLAPAEQAHEGGVQFFRALRKPMIKELGMATERPAVGRRG